MPRAAGPTNAIRATDVIGTKVFGETGEDIGDIQDIILDKKSDRLLFAVVRMGGALVAMQNFYALPWSALNFDDGKNAYVVPYTRDEVGNAPSGSMVSDLTEDDGAKGLGKARGMFKLDTASSAS